MSDADTVIVEDDDASHVSYHPPGAWDGASGADHQMFHGSSYHDTHAADAFLLFTFNGSYVEYHSDSNFDHGDSLVSIDGQEPTRVNSYAPSWTEGSALFTATLDPGQHTLRITNIVDGNFTGLDYFVYRPFVPPATTVPDPGPSAPPQTDPQGSTSAITSPSPPTNGTPHGREGLIIGIVGGLAGILVALLSAAAFFLFRRRAKQRQTPFLQSQTVPFIIPHDPPPYADSQARTAPSIATSAVFTSHRPQQPVQVNEKGSELPASPRTSRFFGSESYFTSSR